MRDPIQTLRSACRVPSGWVRALMALSAPLWLAAVSGCGASLPRAEAKQHSSEQYTVVPYPPPSALVEIVPESPDPDAVWVDGYWSWGGRYYVWERGGWVIPQPGAHVCKWSARYEDDGTLMYAPTTWHASSGERIEPPRFLLPAATPPASETAEPATVP